MHNARKELLGSLSAAVEQHRDNDQRKEEQADQGNACVVCITLWYPTTNREVQGNEDQPGRDQTNDIGLRQLLLSHEAILVRHQTEPATQLVASQT